MQNVKAPFLLRVVGRTTVIGCKCDKRTKKNAYSKFCLDYYIKTVDPSVQLSIEVETYWKMLSLTNRKNTHMYFIYGTSKGNQSEAKRLYRKAFPTGACNIFDLCGVIPRITTSSLAPSSTIAFYFRLCII